MSKIVISLLILSFANFGSCEERSNRIIGGDFADKDKWKFLASMVVGQVHYCSGTLIRPKWIVTSARCVIYANYKWAKKCLGEFGARIGPTDMRNGDIKQFAHKDCHKEEYFQNKIVPYVELADVSKVKNFSIHPMFKAEKQNKSNNVMARAHDIALVELEEKAPSPWNPVKIATEKTIYETKNCWTAGWGWTKKEESGFKNDSFNQLRHLYVTQVKWKICKKKMEERFEKYPELSEEMKKATIQFKFCMESKKKGIMITLHGDLGGPLNCAGVIQGICIDTLIYKKKTKDKVYKFVGIYTELVCYFDWINKVFEENKATPFEIARNFSDHCARKSTSKPKPTTTTEDTTLEEEEEYPIDESSVKTLPFNQQYLLLSFFVLFS